MVLPEEPAVLAVPVAADAMVEEATLTNGVNPETEVAPLKAGGSPDTIDAAVLLGLITLFCSF